jgi:hypothetical protein
MLQKSRNLRFAHASAKADAYNWPSVGVGFSRRGREAAFASFATPSFCAKSFLCVHFPVGGLRLPDYYFGSSAWL